MDEKGQIETVLTTSNQIVEQSSDYKLAILAEKDISEKVNKAINIYRQNALRNPIFFAL